MAPRAVLFDLDNTLILEDEVTFQALHRACELATARAGVDPSALDTAVRSIAEERWRAAPTFEYCDAMGIWWGEGLWGEFAGDALPLRALRGFVPGFRREVWRSALEAVGEREGVLADELDATYREARRARQLVDPEAEAVLDDLTRDYLLALVTNGAPDVQREKLAGTTLGSRFSAIVISAEVGVGKPDPRIFRIALDELGTEDAVVIGDSLARDVAGAHRAGLRAIWIDRGLDPAKPDDVVPDASIRALSEIRSVLGAMAPGGASPRGSP